MTVRNMLTPRGMPMLGNKNPTRDRALFNCASRQTEGSSARMVNEAAIAGPSYLGHYFLHGFSNTLMYGDLSLSLRWLVNSLSLQTEIINPRRACARVTVLVLSVCLCVCLSVCLCVCVFSLFWHLAQSGVQTAVSATSARYGHEI